VYVLCFFFQAEDGIRDFHVTGVQTCALPISNNRVHPIFALWHASMLGRIEQVLRSGHSPRLQEWIEDFNPVYVDFSATDYDPFFNINTPQDLYSAEAQLVHVQ